VRYIIYIFITAWFVLSCKIDNPAPVSFLDYSNPNLENLNYDKLNVLNEEIKKGTFGNIHSLLILRNNKIVFENYYAGYKREDLHAIGATTQSIISALVGIMLYEDSTISLRTKIIELFPSYNQYFDNIPQKDKIEIRHLISNTSGFWWDERTHPFGDIKNDAYVMTQSDDWIGNILASPMIREPGDAFNFISGNGILMAPIIQKLTGVELEQYTREKLFDPLEIEDWTWEKISGGFVNASWGLHMKPIDMAKIGQLYINNGKWKEQTFFDDHWKNRSSRNRSSVTNYFNYSYFWWRFSFRADAVISLQKNDVFFSWGDGGQHIFIVPHLNIVMVTTAGNFDKNDTKAFEIFRDYILGSVLDLYQ